MTRQDLETERQRRQVALDEDRTPAERNQDGQFATPPALARQIMDEALTHLRGPIRFLEPAVGSGAFFSALLNVANRDRIERAVGVELDARFAKAADDLWAECGLDVVQGDFTKQTATSDARGNLLVTNPPYVRHHHLDKADKVRLAGRVENELGLSPSGLSGLYVYFLLLSHEWMEEGGVGAWLIPSEWMGVRYGDVVREYLTEQVTLLRVHTFDAADVQFGDALVSSSITFLKKAEPGDDHQVRFTSGELPNPVVDFEVPVEILYTEDKWSRIYQSAGEPAVHDGRTLGDYLKISRGVATGRNSFFIRPRTEFRKLGVPEEFLTPILPSGRGLSDRVIARGPDGYPDLPEPLALLDCDLPEGEVRSEHPDLWQYLTSEEGEKASSAYLARNRSPWYSQETRKPAPFISTYMGRGSDGNSPFRIFINLSDAIARNSLHMLYPQDALASRVADDPEALMRAAKLIEGIVGEWYKFHGREYGGGLHKLEPQELSSLPADRLEEELDLESFRPQPSLL